MAIRGRIVNLLSRIWLFIIILIIIFLGIYFLIGLNFIQNSPNLVPSNVPELISFLSPLLIPVLVVYLNKYSNLGFSSRDTSIVYLERTAYLPDTEIRLVVYKCDNKGITMTNSLLALLELLPITVILHPSTNHVFFVFYGSELNVIRKNCLKGESYLENVFSKVKRLEKDELIDFLDFFYNDEEINLNSDRICKSHTSIDLRETINQFSCTFSNDYHNDVSIKDSKFLSVVKESEYCIFVFRHNHSQNDVNNSDLLEMTNQTLYFSNISIQRSPYGRLGTDIPDDSNSEIDYRFILLNGFNPEIAVEIDAFANFVGLLRILDPNNDKFIDESNRSVQKENELDQITHKKNSSVRIEEQISNKVINVQKGKKTDDNDEHDFEDSFLKFNGPFCDICSKFSDQNESLKRVECCIPNLTFCYDKLLDGENLSRMMTLKQESLDKFLDYTTLILERCSLTQVICYFNVLCFSDQFSRCLNKSEKTAIIQYLTTFLSDQNNIAGSICHQGSEGAINTI